MSEPTVKMVSYFSEHWYKIELLIDGILQTHWMSSVTTKLGIIDKPFLRKWVGEIGLREADMRLFEAGQRGTRIHHAFNVMIHGGPVIYQPWQKPNYTPAEIEDVKAKNALWVVVQYQDEMLALVRLKKWFDVVKPTIIMAEKTVYSLEHKDAGTLDIALKIKGGKYAVNGAKPLDIPAGAYICDLKTGNVVSDEADLQTAAYLKCAEEMGLGQFDGTMILHTGSKNKGGIEGLATHLRTFPDVENDYAQYRIAAKMWEWKHKDDQPRNYEFPSLIQMEVN